MVAARLCAIVAPLTISEARGVPPPTIPDIVTAPPLPPFKLSVWAPSIVLENEMLAPAEEAPPFVVSIRAATPKETAPVIETTPPLVVTFPPKLTAPV